MAVRNGGFTRTDIFEYMEQNKLLTSNLANAVRKVVSHCYAKMNITNINDLDKKKFETRIKNDVHHIQNSWQTNYRSKTRFFKREATWISKEIEQVVSNLHKTGRRKKEFHECGPKVKLRKVKDLLNNSAEELALAAQCKFQVEGERSKSTVIRKVINSSPKSVKLMICPTESVQSAQPPQFTPEEALALISDLKLTKHQYEILRKSAKMKNVNLYPSYKSIQQIKQECYPPISSVKIAENLCEIELQALLDFTIYRISKSELHMFSSLNEDENSLLCYWKWGCDGSSGHSRYKTAFTGTSNDNDSNVLMTSIVPLEIKRQTEHNNVSIWKNQRSSSTRYCRPIRFAFEKETLEKITEEFERMDSQINELRETAVFIENKKINVKHLLMKTMVDGKTCNAVMKNRASSNCYICGATPKEMNNIEHCLQKKNDVNSYGLGLSPLHALIRFFECCIHIAYKLDIKTWQARGELAKKSVEEKKKSLQNKLRSELGLLVDFPKQGGGNTNDGNTARTFFDNQKISTQILGIEPELIERFAIVLKTLSCTQQINVEKFRAYCLDTAKLYVEKYPWFQMPPTVHKILLHGADIINSFPMPIGELSEDVQEARQKDFKKYREGYSRKMSRIDTNTDILHALLISSDPVINNLRSLLYKKEKSLPPEVIFLFCLNLI